MCSGVLEGIRHSLREIDDTMVPTVSIVPYPYTYDKYI